MRFLSTLINYDMYNINYVGIFTVYMRSYQNYMKVNSDHE